MASELFTTEGGNIDLWAGIDKHCFTIHRDVLIASSTVFCDMFKIPQPPTTSTVPQVSIPKSPRILDAVLRSIYPAVSPPEITDPPLLAELFAFADKYEMPSLLHILSRSLQKFLLKDPLLVYVIAIRYELLEEARDAIFASNTRSYAGVNFHEVLRHITRSDLLRFVWFASWREAEALPIIRNVYRWSPLHHFDDCTSLLNHWGTAIGLYSFMANDIEQMFMDDPRLRLGDLVWLHNKIKNLPNHCAPNVTQYLPPQDPDAPPLSCPLQPGWARFAMEDLHTRLRNLANELYTTIF